MLELKQKRGYSYKIFDFEPGEKFNRSIFEYLENLKNKLKPFVIKKGQEEIEVKKTGEFKTFEGHCGHIHYFNKLGVGDGDKRFREIDFTLKYDDVSEGWLFEYHSFHPFIPLYSNDWASFRDLYHDKDQTLGFKPECDRVKGRLISKSNLKKEGFDKLTDQNCVLYDDAFGKGIDLAYIFTRSRMKKIVRIRDKEAKDYKFKFEIDFSLGVANKPNVIRKDNTGSYELDIKKSKLFDSSKHIEIGDDKKDGKEWHTYLDTFLVWDDDNVEVSNVDFVVENGRTYIVKNISKKFIDKSIGPVFTDASASYYSGSGDGYVFNDSEGGTTWETVRNGSTGTAANYTSDKTYAHYARRYSIGSTGFGNIARGFFPFDTSDLPSSISVSAASFHWKTYTGPGIQDSSNDGKDYLTLCGASQASPTELTTSDFDAVDHVEAIDSGERKDLSSMSVETFYTFNLNSAGFDLIEPDGYTLIAMITGWDLENVGPVSIGVNYAQGYYSESTGTGNDPYISITYTEVSAFTPRVMIY